MAVHRDARNWSIFSGVDQPFVWSKKAFGIKSLTCWKMEAPFQGIGMREAGSQLPARWCTELQGCGLQSSVHSDRLSLPRASCHLKTFSSPTS